MVDFWGPTKKKKKMAKRSSFSFDIKPQKRYTPRKPQRTLTKHRTGMPVSLFGDADRDGVANVFDCRPRNKKFQDWKQPGNKMVVVQVPIKRAYAQRGKYNMYKKKYILQSTFDESKKKKWKDKEIRYEKSKDGGYIRKGSLTSKQIEKQIYQERADKEAARLKKKGYTIRSAEIAKNEDGRATGGVVKYSRNAKMHHKDIKEEMTAVHKSREMMSFGSKKEANEYVKKLAKAIKDKRRKVEMTRVNSEDLDTKSKSYGEGRHRILAAMKAGKKTIPVIVYDVSGDLTHSKRYRDKLSKLRVQEARDMARIERQEKAEKVEKAEKKTSAQAVLDDKINDAQDLIEETDK